MRRILVALAPVFCGAVLSTAQAEELFVASDGNDSAAGSLQAPFATLERAQEAAAPGDTVWIRGGEYHFSGTTKTIGVAFTKSGAPDKPIKYFAYADETPVFDLFDLKPQDRVTGLDVRCNWIHLRGLEVRGVRQVIVGDSWGVRIRGDHNVLERLHVHDNEAPGVFITSGASNRVLNCDSHNNYDPLEDGGNGDGFGCHSNGGDNVLRGCRSWSNSDDGFDFINAPGTCTVEHSWSFKNGYVPDTMTAAGNGAGFKSGGFGSPPKIPSSGVPRHVVRFNLAFRNRSQGFYANHHPGGLDFLNNTALGNGVNFDMLVEGGQSTHKLHNNIAAGSGGTVMRFTGGDDSDNSWTLPVMVSDADFASMDDAEALAPRQADGSLPVIKFMHLAAGSDLIDRGMNIGLQFAGERPDLGAFEFGSDEAAGAADGGDSDVGMMGASTAAMPSAGAGAAGAVAQQPGGAAGATSAGPTGTAGRAAASNNAGAPGSAMTSATTSTAGTRAAGGGAGAGPTQASTQPSTRSEAAPAANGCSCRITEGRRPGGHTALALVLGLVTYVHLRTRRRGAERSSRRSPPESRNKSPAQAAPQLGSYAALHMPHATRRGVRRVRGPAQIRSWRALLEEHAGRRGGRKARGPAQICSQRLAPRARETTRQRTCVDPRRSAASPPCSKSTRDVAADAERVDPRRSAASAPCTKSTQAERRGRRTCVDPRRSAVSAPCTRSKQAERRGGRRCVDPRRSAASAPCTKSTRYDAAIAPSLRGCAQLGSCAARRGATSTRDDAVDALGVRCSGARNKKMSTRNGRS